MLEHLCTPENLIEVREEIIDRNQDTIGELLIGTGYGVFRGQSEVEYISQAAAKFNYVGTLVFYAVNRDAELTVGDKTYKPSHMYPKEGDICICRGVRYSITGSEFRTDIHGDLVGFTVRCSNA
jgi:hypothetical protein